MSFRHISYQPQCRGNVRVLAILFTVEIEPRALGPYCHYIAWLKTFICKYICVDTQLQFYLVQYYPHKYKRTIASWVKMCHSPADGKVLQPGGWKRVIDKLLGMSYSLVGGNVSSQLCGKNTFTGVAKKNCGQGTFINAIARCEEMCLRGYVAKTHSPLLPKSSGGWTHL